ncbi:hypothetical protein EI42_05009 [Thermosporothrix hazakensis]|jgi:hypothetical protein|uniref:Uncharacterized protein n=2 Tax=Thermosporothrix TaxID=768650 RepID=A0A326U021_THEHA|nr:hypothetical protein [Thermosporothrix hazakensis]PZW23387.1 hypothetical protein EI42_05009 [Thermosporothrix hazakensis]BBH89732.1 hypothetical protein KTC_44830 [Thermosporothrix sp. COM3]GCE47921.1 hypothetical protein KTH_27900 [Thermosporothrix hazakensis]
MANMLRTIFLREDLKPLEEQFLLFLGCRLDGCPGEGKSIVILPIDAERVPKERTPLKELREIIFPDHHVIIRESHEYYSRLSKLIISSVDIIAYTLLVANWDKDLPKRGHYG